MAPTNPSSCLQFTRSTSQSLRNKGQLLRGMVRTQHLRTQVHTPRRASQASLSLSINMAVTDTTLLTTLTSDLVVDTVTALLRNVRTLVATQTTRKLQIAVSVVGRTLSRAHQTTARVQAPSPDMRNRLQIPVVSTVIYTGRSVGCLISYSGLVFVRLEELL